MTVGNEPRRIAEAYAQAGLSPIPLKPRSKEPEGKWGEFDVQKDGFDKFRPDSNIGVKLGTISGGLVDVDCDWPEARIFAARVLANLPSFGRAMAQGGHRLARVSDECKTKKFLLPPACKGVHGLPEEHALCVIEVRCDGAYTMFPGSIHPNGDRIEWETENGGVPGIPEITPEELGRRVGLIAFLSVILRFYPGTGCRDDMHMALSGALARAGFSAENIDKISIFLARHANDGEAEKRGKGVQTHKKLEEKEDVTGIPRLVELLNLPQECCKIFAQWIGCESHEDKIAEFIERMNRKHSVVKDFGGKCVVLTTQFDPENGREYYSVQRFFDIENSYSNVLLEIAKTKDGKPVLTKGGRFWLNNQSRREYDTAGLYPNGCPATVLNFWKGFSIQPVRGSCDLIYRHILEVLANGDRTAYEYIIRWLAFCFQFPGVRAEVALVFRGGRGTGKSIIVKAICDIFGQHGMHISGAKQLIGNFSGHFADKTFIYVDEAYWPGDMSAHGNLKRMITESDITIEKKFVDAYNVPNRLKIVFTSNERWVIPAGEDERRFAVFEVSGKYQQDLQYFSALDSELRGDGLKAFLYDMLQMDIKGWHPRQSIPKTTALRDQQIESLGPVEKAFFNCLEQGWMINSPQERDGLEVSTRAFTEYVRSYTKNFRVTPHRVGIFLGGQPASGNMNFSKTNKRPRGYLIPPLKEARKKWDEIMFSYDWDDAEEWEIDHQDSGSSTHF